MFNGKSRWAAALVTIGIVATGLTLLIRPARPPETRGMVTIEDVERPSVPFPETRTILFPPASKWDSASERRIDRSSRP